MYLIVSLIAEETIKSPKQIICSQAEALLRAYVAISLISKASKLLVVSKTILFSRPRVKNSLS